MLPTVRKIFINLKLSLLILIIGVSLLGLQLISITQYSQRLAALKNQHILIDKIIAIDLTDIQMAAIILNGHVAELALSVKLSLNETFMDQFLATEGEKTAFSNALRSSSAVFQDASLFWLESVPHARTTMHHQMVAARNTYLSDIDHMIDYQIQLINQSISLAEGTAAVLFFYGLIIFILYRFRLNQIYRDISKACSVDTDGSKPEVSTQEIDFIVKRLARKAPIANVSQSLLHPLSGLNNEKGMLTLFNTKKLAKNPNSLFLTLFEIDQYTNLSNSLSKEDMAALYKKIGEIITMYEQPMDVTAHLEDNTFAFIMSRNSKDNALSDAEKIVHSVHDSIFNTAKGPIKVTLSGGFLLKTPVSSLESCITDALKIAIKAKENGGNRVAQLRDRTDSFR